VQAREDARKTNERRRERSSAIAQRKLQWFRRFGRSLFGAILLIAIVVIVVAVANANARKQKRATVSQAGAGVRENVKQELTLPVVRQTSC